MIKQAKNLMTTPVTYPHTAGVSHVLTKTVTLSDALDVSEDFFEIAALPLRSRLTRVRVSSENISEAATLIVGLISGEYADTFDTERTLGDELIAAGDKNTEIEVPLAALLAIDHSDINRGIGFNFSADIAGAADKKVHIHVEYAAV